MRVPDGSDGSVWVIGHRGASRDCPENTIAAFDEALHQGADGIELDLQLSRDGVPVVYHDKTLRKAGGGRKRVAQLDLRDIKRLDAGSWLDKKFRGQHIPTLEEVLARYGRKTRLLLEIKTREGSAGRDRHLLLARSVAALVRQTKTSDAAMLLSFDGDVLEACAGEAPGLRCVLNLKPPRALRETLRERLRPLFALSVDVRTLTPAFAAAVREAGKPILAYTCNTPRRLERALRAGAIGVLSDRPGWLKTALERSQTRDGA